MQQDKALVLFSGGQDSTVCLAWALTRFAKVETIGFDYGQRHKVELECREKILQRLPELKPEWKKKLGADRVLQVDALHDISAVALTRSTAIVMQKDGLPNTFVPGRNLLFFTLAGAVAYRRGIGHLVGGMCETDYSGYPDCRDDTLKALQVALSLGMGRRCVLHTPLMWEDKAATWRMAEALGGKAFVRLIRTATHTCYLGDRTHKHDWGYGCGRCPACQLRRAGYRRYCAGLGRTKP